MGWRRQRRDVLELGEHRARHAPDCHRLGDSGLQLQLVQFSRIRGAAAVGPSGRRAPAPLELSSRSVGGLALVTGTVGRDGRADSDSSHDSSVTTCKCAWIDS